MIDTIASSPPLIAICGIAYMGAVIWVMFYAGREAPRAKKPS
jgi:hypothetical protein